MKKRKTKGEILKELMENSKTRKMIENTDRMGGHLISGNIRMTI